MAIAASCTYSQDTTHYSLHYVTGYNVNVRTAPDLRSKILYEANWGDKYFAKRHDNFWFQIYSWNEFDIYYIHSDFLKDFDGFIQKALKQPNQNSKTKLLMIDYYIGHRGYDSAIKLAIDLIEKEPEETIFSGFEQCELVSHSAYQKISALQEDPKAKEFDMTKFKKKISNPTILNLIELTEIEELIRDRGYDLAYEKLNRILEERSDYLFIRVNCDYDVESKDYPLFYFKNLYFINYHLMSEEGKKEVTEYLQNAIRNWEDSGRREIAFDISRKLNVFSRSWAN